MTKKRLKKVYKPMAYIFIGCFLIYILLSQAMSVFSRTAEIDKLEKEVAIVKKEKKELVRMVPVVFTSAAAGILTWLLCRDEGRKADRIGFALITAGGLSNLYDRLKRGYVVDYFSIRCKYLEKVVFNLGDFFIFAGSALIAASDLLGAVRDLSSPAEAHIKALRLPWRKTDEAE